MEHEFLNNVCTDLILTSQDFVSTFMYPPRKPLTNIAI